MVDITKENKIPESAATPDKEFAQPKTADNASQPSTSARQEMSRGEKWYNWIVYSGLNYWVVLIASLGIADFLTHGKGRDGLDSFIGKTAKALNKSGVPMEKAYHHSKVSLETLTLNVGGWVLLVPLKQLEDHKRPIVHWLNKKMGVNQTAADGHELTPDEIYLEKEQPKQGWGRVLWRRALASSTTVVAGWMLDEVAANRNVKMEHTYSLDPHDPRSEKVTLKGHLGGKEYSTNTLVDFINHCLGNVPGGNKIVNSPVANRWLKLAALDVFFTKMTSTVMWMTRNGGKKSVVESIVDEPPQTGPELPIETADPAPVNQDREKLKSKKPIPITNYAELAKQDSSGLSLTH